MVSISYRTNSGTRILDEHGSVASISARFSDILRENYPHLCGNLSHLRTSSSYIVTHHSEFCNSFFKIFYLFLCRNERFSGRVFCAFQTNQGEIHPNPPLFTRKTPAKLCFKRTFGGCFANIYQTILYIMPVSKSLLTAHLTIRRSFSPPSLRSAQKLPPHRHPQSALIPWKAGLQHKSPQFRSSWQTKSRYSDSRF